MSETRPFLHRTWCKQTATADATEDQFAQLIVDIIAQVAPPWKHDTPNDNRFLSTVKPPQPEFGYGPPPAYVFFRFHSAHIEARALSNRALREFFESFVEEPAAKAGIKFSLSAAQVEIPEEFQRNPIEIPGLGQMTPKYVNAPSIRYDGGWTSETEPLRCLNGLPMAFAVEEEPLSEEEAAAIGQTISEIRELEPSAILDASQLVFEHYEAFCRGWSEDDCHAYDVPVLKKPEEVWKHMQFTEPAQVWVDSPEPPHTVDFNAECRWDIEHGIQLRFQGNQITEVGSQ